MSRFSHSICADTKELRIYRFFFQVSSDKYALQTNIESVPWESISAIATTNETNLRCFGQIISIGLILFMLPSTQYAAFWGISTSAQYALLSSPSGIWIIEGSVFGKLQSNVKGITIIIFQKNVEGKIFFQINFLMFTFQTLKKVLLRSLNTCIFDDIMIIEHLPSLTWHFEIILEVVKSRKIYAKIMILVHFFKVVLGVI